MGNEPPKPEIPVKDQIKEQKRGLERSARGIEREMRKLEREEKKILAEMKKMGKKGQDVSNFSKNTKQKAARQLAKDVVRTRTQISKMNEFAGQLKATALKLSSVSTLNDMYDAMANATNAMCMVSNKLDATKLSQMSREMAMADGKLEMKQEMLSSVLEEIGNDMEDPIESEKLFQDVLKEVGLDVQGALPEVKTSKVEVNKSQVKHDDLDEMLNSLNNK